ncbi:MAG TPA: TerC family protein [Desulfobacterales bacterium]
MVELLTDPQIWVALLTLTALEIILGIDNIIFIAILAGRLPAEDQKKGRTIGLIMALLMRIALLFSLSLIMQLTTPLFAVWSKEISGRDMIMLAGGLFLLGKSTLEIHANLEGAEGHHQRASGRKATLTGVIAQIAVLDIVFSLDSVITAIGLVGQLPVMIAAIVIAIGFMIFTAGPVSHFIEKHPALKILALSFLLLIGLALMAEGLDLHIPKGYIYFAMAFAVFVEMLNMRIRRRRPEPVRLRKTPTGAGMPEDHRPQKHAL